MLVSGEKFYTEPADVLVTLVTDWQFVLQFSSRIYAEDMVAAIPIMQVYELEAEKYKTAHRTEDPAQIEIGQVYGWSHIKSAIIGKRGQWPDVPSEEI